MTAIDYLGAFFFFLLILISTDYLFTTSALPNFWRKPIRLALNVVLAAVVTMILYVILWFI